ncbi:hypothetical protein DPX16_11906 [Anabarilius grahami]|uniref:Uncharacterized protein n=1 Tax=Anabarilius grahami TaxID=495550 RepID=A0A3N0YCP5_ANAGA|nr:hypothetical protein DPX16_11906 [Anabarilius grahami]
MGKSICTGSAEEDSSLYQERVNVFGNNSSRTSHLNKSSTNATSVDPNLEGSIRCDIHEDNPKDFPK